ncbi:phosphoribosylaminoimidazolesuccinocarboxamide synthase [Flavobacterium zepuense]|uniref:Phosphoribosylaminoimidazolesuccinocarboxamide synthase n=1 Tax=Flavobacterium zepuense TaxID=2593302 RepID=A0A552UYM2_9FLAO|nr:phosphoribosylaminoimidazolesuccinocarboxamide synthase [Flavobacterium zepuense]TRW23260.1 phosphoribosylaminoimidazolesuccinocarboxamide synthase [Flavobacterium zepuense]
MEEKVFRTKTGYCHILPDKIVLTRDGVVGDLSKIAVGNSIVRILFIYGTLAAYFLYRAYNEFAVGQNVWAFLYLAMAVFLLFAVLRSKDNSGTPVIERSAIKEVVLKKAVKGVTRGYFEVYFSDKNNKLKKRLIMLPGSLTDGDNETEKAVRMMRKEGLLKN